MKSTSKIHRFYLNFAFCAALLLGFILVAIFEIRTFLQNFWAILSLALLAFSFILAKKFTLATAILAGILLSFWRFSNFSFERAQISKNVGENISISGKIFEDPDANLEKGEISLKIDAVEISGEKVRGRIFAKIKTEKQIRRGDEITLRGKLSAGFGGFSASIYRANVVKITAKEDFIRDLRDDFSQKIRTKISSPEVDLGLGFLLGQKNSLPAELENALRATALTHIVVASGYNLTVLVNFARKIFGKFSKNLTFFAMIFLISIFVLIVGFSPSMTRAGIVAILSVIFGYFGRKFRPIFLLIFVAGLTLMISPANIFDLGWQLSFGSFFGVMIFAPILKNFLFENPEKLGSLANIFFETFAAQISTLPLILFAFEKVPLASIFANLLILPTVPFAMLATFLTGVFSMILPVFAEFFGFFAENILRFSIFVANFFAAGNFTFEIKLNFLGVIFAYFSLAILTIFLAKKTAVKL